MTATFLALALPIALTGFALNRLLPRDVFAAGRPAAVLALAVGLALAFSSITFFAWVVAGNRLGCPLWLLEATVGLAASGLVWRLAPAAGPLSTLPSPTPIRPLIVVAATLVLGMTVAFLARQHRFPAGTDDAVSIWNLHARVLYRAPADWPAFFGSAPVTGGSHADHPDYPLLLPGAIARLSTYAGAERPEHGSLVAFLFTASLVTLAYAAVAARHGVNAGLLCAAALLGTSGLMKSGASQYGDVPFAFFVLASIVPLSWHFDRNRTDSALPLAAGAAAGAAAWTKNEGLLFVLALSVGFAVASLSGPWRAFRREASLALLGSAPLLVAVLVFKLAYAPQNDLIAGQDLDAFRSRLLDPSRCALIVTGWADAFFTAGKALVPVLLAHPFLMGLSRNPPPAPVRRLAGVTLVATFLGYSVVYLATPHDLAWHLETSAGRLILHLWPAAVVCLFWHAASPDEIHLGGSGRRATPISCRVNIPQSGAAVPAPRRRLRTTDQTDATPTAA